jgi:hypothetical protein
MTQRKTAHEANPEGYSGLTHCVLNNVVYKVASVNFEEDLIAIDKCNDDEFWWYRIESFEKVFNIKM